MGLDNALSLLNRFKWVSRVRPMIAGDLCARILAPERRTIVNTAHNLRYFIDPLSMFGETIARFSKYEDETEDILRRYLREGDSFLDIGANEGYFSVLAASITGQNGYTAAIEPQSKLCDIIDINASLNNCKVNIYNGAFGGTKNETCKLYVYPSLNPGASNLIRPPRFSRSFETVSFIDASEVFANRRRFSVVKVDVEGFEDNVVSSMLDFIRAGQVSVLLLDYHAVVLEARGVDPKFIERSILSCGMALESRDSPQYSGYRVYRYV